MRFAWRSEGRHDENARSIESDGYLRSVPDFEGGTMRRVILPILTGLAILVGTPAWADPIVLFNTFGPGNSFDARGGLNAFFDPSNSSALGRDIDLANAFVSRATARLKTVRLPLAVVAQTGLQGGGQFVSRGDEADVFLMGDAAGSPASLLESFHFGNLATSAAIITLNSATHPELISGQRYWLGLSTGPEPTLVTWLSIPGFATGLVANRRGEGPWRVVNISGESIPAFSVTGTSAVSPTPEPSSLFLLIGATAATIANRWRRPRCSSDFACRTGR